jgi:Putative transposase
MFTPIEFLRRLATLIPPPHRHLTRYHGVFAPIPIYALPLCTPPLPINLIPRLTVGSPSDDLLKRVFAVDVLVCDNCGTMRILAALPASEASRAILEHLGLPTEPPPQTRAPLGRRFDDT